MINHVSNVTGTTLGLEAEPASSIIAPEELVQNSEGYDIDLIGLELAGKLLANDRTLADYRLQKESKH